MTIRTSFVEHFGEDNAVRVEEAATAHLAEGASPFVPDVHAADKWGSDAFRYLFLVCIGRDCFTRWRRHHNIDVEYEEILTWALEFADLHMFDGDIPDFLAVMAGAYVPWFNYEKTGIEEPGIAEEWRKRNLEWAHMNEAEFGVEMAMTMEEMQIMSERGMRLLDNHDTEGPL